MDQKAFDRKVRLAWPSESVKELSNEKKNVLKKEIKAALKNKNAVIIAHYYTDSSIQELAEETGGFIGDSLEMARFGAESSAQTLIVAGVRFMGETAKIISPEKKVQMPDISAECSLDLGCEPDEFKRFCQANPDRTVVVYANTSAEIKALADWTVTSSIAVDVVKHLTESGKKVIWAPDRYLGSYIKDKTSADMLIWDACCVVHREFDAAALLEMKKADPDAVVLVHPESQPDVIAAADVVGSTSQLLNASRSSSADKFIVATETGIFHKMKKASPGKTFIVAPSKKINEECFCKGECPWMKLNSLEKIMAVLQTGGNEILVEKSVIERALLPLNRMLEFKKRSA